MQGGHRQQPTGHLSLQGQPLLQVHGSGKAAGWGRSSLRLSPNVLDERLHGAASLQVLMLFSCLTGHELYVGFTSYDMDISHSVHRVQS